MALSRPRHRTSAALLALGAGFLLIRRATRPVTASRSERTRSLASDDFIPLAAGSLTHGVTIRGTPGQVWPWLVQMGAGRAGWYSYDALDNGGHPSARTILPEFQHIRAGEVMPALPGATDAFTVLDVEPERRLTLGWVADGAVQASWAFELAAVGTETTRLIVRARAAPGYRFRGLPTWAALAIIRPVHFVMQRRQLLGIARRVERSSPAKPRPILAALFDMDGVVTETATAHAAAWTRLFDEFLRARADATGEPFRPFDAGRDYLAYVDGRPRYEGVARFLESRGITLPHGDESDPPEAETICGLGNRKNRYFRAWLENHEVHTFPDARWLLDHLRIAGVRTAIFSASRNAGAVLERAGLTRSADVVVTGAEAAALGLAGKPDPAELVEAARRLGVAPAQAAVFEDATAGIAAAVRGGFAQAIGVDRSGGGSGLRKAGATFVVSNLHDVSWARDGRFDVKTLRGLPLVADHMDEVARRAAGKRLAVFLDYDGTLTPIVEDYTKAFLSGEVRAAVASLAARCPVAVVSGRDVEVVRNFVGLDQVYYAGSHGFDIRGPSGWNRHLERGVEFLPVIDDVERRLREALAGIPGHAVERKRFSIAVHYRRSADLDLPRIASIVDHVLAAYPGLRLGQGKKVFRIQPGIEWDKGHAVRWLLEQLGLDGQDVLPIYVGDDITDEDAFREVAGSGLAVVVRDLDDRPTAADYALADTADVARFLQRLVALAQRPATGPESAARAVRQGTGG